MNLLTDNFNLFSFISVSVSDFKYAIFVIDRVFTYC